MAVSPLAAERAAEPAAEPCWYALAAAEVADSLDVAVERGLTAAEADRRLREHGPNRLEAGAHEPGWRAFLRQYSDVMQIVLLAAGVGSLYPLKQLGTGLVLIGLTVFNALLGLHQEGKAAEAIAALQKMMVVKVRARRDGRVVELPAEQLVPGDVVMIEAGDVVPADGRLVEAASLEVDESALTGESLPVEKSPDTLASADTELGDRTDMVFMNTNVTRGTGELIVTDTGMSTQVGHISHMLATEEQGATPLTRQLAKLTNQILILAGLALVISVALNLSRGASFTAVFIAAIAFAIAAIPTGLPAVVTAILSFGTQRLADAKAIVKRLRSAETLGSTSAINSDKTGTLTLNQMTAVELVIPGRRYRVSGEGYSSEGTIKHVAGEPEVALDQFLQPMVLASDAVVEGGELVGDPTEGAMVVLAEKGGIDTAGTREALPRVAELPFDAEYKLMATFHRMRDEHGQDVVRCFVKGAPDQLLARSAAALDPALQRAQVDDAFRGRYVAENQRLGEQGLRVMATARRDFEPAGFDPSADLLALIEGLTLLSLVGIVDPPRPEARKAIATSAAAGIRVRMITGDHAVTAQAIAEQLGIPGRAITGADFGAMNDEQAAAAIEDIGVIARVTPEQKVRLVETLKRRGDVVAMTGDGVNDAPALKRADIGVAMGITGTEVAKEAATMILTDDNFATIVRAVEIGRGIYDNLTKYIRFQMGALAGFVLTFLAASVFNIVGGAPFLPLQTLWINFTTQVSQSVGLGYGQPAEGLMSRRPRDVDEPILNRRLIVWLAIVGLVHAAATLAVIEWAVGAHGEAIARTMGITTFALANVFFSFATHDERRSIFSMTAFEDPRFLYATAVSLAAIFLGAQLGVFERILQTRALSLHEWLLCILAAASIAVVSELHYLWLRRERSGRSSGVRAGETTAEAT